jgi:hypothetical protein
MRSTAVEAAIHPPRGRMGIAYTQTDGRLQLGWQVPWVRSNTASAIATPASCDRWEVKPGRYRIPLGAETVSEAGRIT